MSVNNIKNLLIISGYPSENNPVYTFVDQLVCQFAENGIKCTVISPFSVTKSVVRRQKKKDLISTRVTKSGKKIKIYRPRYISYSYYLFNFNTSKLTYRNFKKSVYKELRKRNIKPDAVYGHFIAPSGMCAADLGSDLGIPSFLAYGESSVKNFSSFDKQFVKEKLSKMAGIISVSSANKQELLDLNLIEDPDLIGIFPNGVDKDRFFKIDKIKARRDLNIPEDLFIVVFVGRFVKSKGVHILSKVLNEMNDTYSIFIGSGPIEPACKNILFKGRVENENIYKYLNAADIFVLPTKAEGCCNAIIEAMACGLPIISSNKKFNDDILCDENSIRINEEDELEIKEAITLLKNNPAIREKMSAASMLKASNLDLKQRAKNIINFMETKIDQRRKEYVD